MSRLTNKEFVELWTLNLVDRSYPIQTLQSSLPSVRVPYSEEVKETKRRFLSRRSVSQLSLRTLSSSFPSGQAGSKRPRTTAPWPQGTVSRAKMISGETTPKQPEHKGQVRKELVSDFTTIGSELHDLLFGCQSPGREYSYMLRSSVRVT